MTRSHVTSLGNTVCLRSFTCQITCSFRCPGHNQDPLEWSARQKIAVGAARGLRYLHEECRVGCIVHRDLRPNNILLTHDFEPLVRPCLFISSIMSIAFLHYGNLLISKYKDKQLIGEPCAPNNLVISTNSMDSILSFLSEVTNVLNFKT